MRSGSIVTSGGVIAAALAAALPALGQEISAVRIASGLSRPVFVTAPAGDTNRIFIVEQRSGSTGRVRIYKFDSGQVLGTPYLSVTVSTGSEQGLLGLAFHPDYANNGYVYVNYTRSDGDTVIQRFTVSGNPDVVDSGSGQIVMIIDQPFSNHNGGYLAFGPDGYLYIPTGDGGSANDPGNRAQNINELLGKILRIDVNGDDFPADPNKNYANPAGNPYVGVDGLDEIWAIGLRNPWRGDFDNQTGDFYMGDVGQDAREEIDFQPASSTGGENYGWRCKEGTRCTGLTGCSCADTTLVDPIYEYNQGPGCSVTGGVVYRGGAFPALSGTYFFSDFCDSRIFSFRYDGSNVTEFTNRTSQLIPDIGTIDSVSSFGEDAFGEMYICDLEGEVFKMVPLDDITCDEIKKFKGSCKDNGTVKVVLRLNTESHHGDNVTIGINGQDNLLVINGSKAVFKACCFAGPVTASLEDPAGCESDLLLQCP
ncbi:MAG: PQQ-dependent sugar dehydrogenase [Phycisphaerae bacterium]|nr:MAG: hypothetical protein EDS66_09125 [Planctomycetota bacterium]KAB2947426.1 MAG: PQQ-dependent sugar dehydrogenase [Phycisphaerae bacterium]MBE7456338.1 PQQ-dependent sugar dehydrogenase [Planctomycetia bacterium]MCK6465668.1 PQQ-dependent sugar dehydrogenase [Phycisphaerae bacterium]MCL4718456.1 PQQ-dependent sugar dehydrogenase [Phycisphaerae bacterium]